MATAVVGADPAALQQALAAVPFTPGTTVTAGRGWPHPDTADALRPYAEHADASTDSGAWLLVVAGQVIGDLGWLGGPAEDGDCEIGYGIAGPARRQGLGTEAVEVLCAWAERQPGVARLTAEVLVGNEPSRRLLLRLGFTEQPAPPPHVRYVRPAPGPGTAAR